MPAALNEWAAEHRDQLSAETVAEVLAIAAAIEDSPIGERSIMDLDLGDSPPADLESLFTRDRAERAATLIEIVGRWAAKRTPILAPEYLAGPLTDRDLSPVSAAAAPTPIVPVSTPPSPAPITAETHSVTDTPTAPSTPSVGTPPGPDTPSIGDTTTLTAVEPSVPAISSYLGDPTATRDQVQPTAVQPSLGPDVIKAPAFLHSDRIDEEDDVRLYGPRRRGRRWLLGVAALVAVGAAGAGTWYLVGRSDDTPASDTASVTTDASTADEVADIAEPTVASDLGSADAPTPDGEQTATEADPGNDTGSAIYWADTSPILNSGTASIIASTYSVSAANRAVLTGHTAAITGIVISDGGRVLTSGADRRLVDWGSDVTLAKPDVVNVASPLTVLARTVDQRLVAGDSAGNITIIDLVNTAEPLVIPVHLVAISAIAELTDGRLAVASVDGDVKVFAVGNVDGAIDLRHDVEVTAMVALPDAGVATAAVDGLVRLWSPDTDVPPGIIDTHGAPVTALRLLSDGQLVSGAVDGTIHVLAAENGATPSLMIEGHPGAVRALREITTPDGIRALASGGDDSTIRIWDLATGAPVRVLEGHGDLISGIDVLPDGRLVSISADGTGRVWDLTVASGPLVLPPHERNISAIQPLSDDQFVTGGVDGLVVLGGTSQTSVPTVLTRHDSSVVGITVLADGRIVSLDASSVMRVSAPDGAGTLPIEITVAPGATSIAARGDGVVTGHADGSVRLHDLTSEVAVVEAHGSSVNDVLVLSNGQVVSAGQDKTARVIDFDQPDLVKVFDLHSAAVDVVIELPDGRIASAGTDAIYIWSLDGLAQGAVRLTGNRSTTLTLLALPNNRLLSASADGRVRIWDLNAPDAEPTTLIDIPGIVNPYLIEAGNGQIVAGAARGYVVFSLS